MTDTDAEAHDRRQLRCRRVVGFCVGVSFVLLADACFYALGESVPIPLVFIVNLPVSCCCLLGPAGVATSDEGDGGDGGLSIVVPVAIAIACCFWGWIGSFVAPFYFESPAPIPIAPSQTSAVGPPTEPDLTDRFLFVHSRPRDAPSRPPIEPKPESDSLPR